MMLVAVLDADVVFPMILRDTLLRVAAAGGFRVHWSARILEEMRRNLVKVYGMAPAKAATLQTVMERAFPDAMVEGWEPLEALMPNDPKDRHVVAAAATIGADLIVTSNLKHFRALPSGLIAVSPDDLLVRILKADPHAVLDALRGQAAAYQRPALTVMELLQQLSRFAPTFAKAAAALAQTRFEN